MDDLFEDEPLAEFETLAAELARLAGAEVETAFGRALTVDYKGAAGSTQDPVSDVDHAVEVLLRARIGERYSEHDIIGEEIDDRPGRDHSHVWAVDPVDGTANFVNGLPLFASSVGLLIDGRPAVGAVWCSTSHLLKPGVYSARAGGALHFDGALVARTASPGIRGRLLGLPQATDIADPRFQSRKTGSAAIECAFVAAGLLAGARFRTPNIWDVAGGVVLVQAASGESRRWNGSRWAPLESFAEGAQGGDLAHWSGALLVGQSDAVEALIANDGS